MLQETHSDLKNASDWTREWDGLSFLSHNTSLSGGVAICFVNNFNPHSFQVEEIVKGRLLKVRVNYDKNVIIFICVYCPVSAIERMVFLNILCSVLQKCNQEEFLFLGGDFNCTVNHLEPHLPSRNRLIQFVNMHELCDVWRRLNGMQKQYTWTHVRDRIISMARLDRFYIFKHHYNIIRNCHIVPVSFSDHCMVKCSVFINLLKPKSAYWQFNTALLSDTHFKECFNYFWEDFKTKKVL